MLLTAGTRRCDRWTTSRTWPRATRPTGRTCTGSRTGCPGLRADAVAVRVATAAQAQGAPALADEQRGAAAVARTFAGRAQAAQVALVDGRVGAVWAPGGQLRAVFDLTVRGGRVVVVDVLADPAVLGRLMITLL